MKGTEASVLVVLSSLAALARARRLQVDDVPVECATICGPIVELSYKCVVDNSFEELRRLKRRKVEAVEDRIPHPKAGGGGGGGGGGVVRRHQHRSPNQNQADVEATPTVALDAAATDGNVQQQEQRQGQRRQQQPAQDALQPPQDASPVFIATLPSAASGEDPQLSTTSAQVTPTSEAAQTTTPSTDPAPRTTPSPDPRPSSSSSSSSSAPPPPPPKAPTSVSVVPVFAQPTSTVFLTASAPSSTPIPRVTVPAPSLPPIQPSSPPVTVPPSPPPQQAPSTQQPPPAQQPSARPPQQQQPPPAPSSLQSTSSPPPPPRASMSMSTAVPTTGEAPGRKEPDQKPPADDKNTAEKNCICGNKSFDVNLLAGMCQSCIRKSGNRASDMDLIMGQCNFTEATYTPDQDKLVYDIRVVAQNPLLSHSANALGDAGRIGDGCALAAAAVGFVAGLVLLL